MIKFICTYHLDVRILPCSNDCLCERDRVAAKRATYPTDIDSHDEHLDIDVDINKLR